MPANTYDPKLVVVTFAGAKIIGYAEGEFISAERNEQGFTLMVGSDGRGIRNRNPNRSGIITLTLQASSPSNDFLSARAKLDETVGTGFGPFFMKDLSGTTLVTAPSAWIQKMATAAFAKEADSNREWVFETDALEIYVGGMVVP